MLSACEEPALPDLPVFKAYLSVIYSLLPIIAYHNLSLAPTSSLQLSLFFLGAAPVLFHLPPLLLTQLPSPVPWTGLPEHAAQPPLPGVAVSREGGAGRVALCGMHAGTLGALHAEAFIEELSLWGQRHQDKDLNIVTASLIPQL